MQKRLGFLCGAPRATTRPGAETSGVRSRLVGLLMGFESIGWEVKPFIVGDRVSQKLSAEGSGQAFKGHFLRTLAVDFVRLLMGIVNSWLSWRELGRQVDWVYEYAATLQSLGWIFKRNGIVWILQTEAPLFYEAKVERKALVLSNLARWLEVRAYHHCDVLVAVSETRKQMVINEHNVPAKKIVVLSNGVDSTFFDPAKYKPKRLFDNFVVGFVGNLQPWAGLDLLLEAIYDLYIEGLDISLVVVGDGDMFEVLQEQAKKLDLTEKVVFVGRVSWEKIPEYIAGFDVGYAGPLPMQLEKMYLSPLKLYEYMAMATPTIAANFDDAKQTIQDGETGFLFEGGNKTDLIRVLKDAYQTQPDLPEIGQKAREEIVTNHSWSSRIRHAFDEIENILSGPQMN